MLLLYLHRLLTNDDDDWMKKALLTLQSLNIGWFKKIMSLIEQYELPSDFESIRRHPPGEWKYKVLSGIEKKNKERLLQDCHKVVDGVEARKTKTSTIVDKINIPNFNRKPIPEIMNLSKSETRTLMIARYGMLQCGKNFGGTLNNTCDTCDCLDDENHRLNFCPKWGNNSDDADDEIIPFELVYSSDPLVLDNILPRIEQTWNTKNGHGTMNI